MPTFSTRFMKLVPPLKLNTIMISLCLSTATYMTTTAFSVTVEAATTENDHTSTRRSTTLSQSYKLALQNNPEWAASLTEAESALLNQKLAKSRFYPQVVGEISYNQIQYNGSSIDFDLSPEKIQSCISGISQNEIDALTIGTLSNTVENNLSCLFTSSENNFAATTYTLGLTQSLYRPDLWQNLKKSVTLESLATLKQKTALQDLLLNTAKQYFSVIQHTTQLIITKAEERTLHYHKRLANNRFQKGLVKREAILSIKAQHALATAQVFNAKNALANAHFLLEQLTQSPNITITGLPKNFQLDAPKPANPEAWIEVALQQSPELLQTKYATTLHRQEHAAKRAARRPMINAFAGLSESDSGGSTPIMDEGKTRNLSFGINASIPLYTGGGLSLAEKKAKLDLKRAEFQQEQARVKLQYEVRQYYHNILATISLAKAQKQVLDSTKRQFKSITKGYEIGSKTTAEFLNQQRAFYLAKRDLVLTEYNYVLQTLGLKRLVGILSKQDLDLLSQWLPSQVD